MAPAILVTLLLVRESTNPAAARPDWIGFATFTAFLALLVYGLINSSHGWGQPNAYLSLLGAAVLCAVFLVVEARRRHPMLDLSLFRKPTFNGALIAAFGLNASIYSLFTFVVLYLQQELHYTAIEAGLRSLPLTAAMSVASTVAGRLTTVVPARVMIRGGFVLVGTGIMLMTGLRPDSDWTHLLPGLIVAGLGGGLVTVPLASTAVSVVDINKAGMASGANATARQIGLATGIAVLGSVFADASRTSFSSGLNTILLIGAAISYLSAVLSFALIRRRDIVAAPTREPGTAEPDPTAEAVGS